MKIEKIKPIPKYILTAMQKLDKVLNKKQNGYVRFYSYLTKNDGELVKVTVAVKCRYKKWYAKQVAVHGVHSEICYVKDMEYNYLAGYMVGWYDMGFSLYPRWYEDGRWVVCFNEKMYDPYAPIVNKNYLSKFPEYKYAALELYDSANILKYLRTYEEYPQLEYLMKLGLKEYIFSKQILRKMGKDKAFCKWLARTRVEISGRYYYVSTIINAYKKKKSIYEIDAFEKAKKTLSHDKDFKPIREMLRGDYAPYFKYINEKKISNRLYLDYLKACNFLELDMSIPKNRYPHDFKRWHDIRIDEYKSAKALKEEKEREELYKKFAEVAKKYLPLQHDQRSCFIAIIAKSPAELVNEGDALHHCVGRMGYDQKFVRGESLIFFIRSKDNPDTPLVTLEYSPTRKKVLQCYGDNDSNPPEDVMQYVNKVWLPYANRTLKKIAA